jgi:POT family proton-dependent oligopeptide transporter
MSESAVLGANTDIPKGHPRGLWVLFITEMWERFSYYGMRALLVLYLIASTNKTLADGTANTNPGFGWTEADAYSLYGWYTGFVYITPLAGGWLADRFLGTHRSMLIGGWIIALGHITLACTEFFGISAGEVVTMQTSPAALVTFVAGLVLIVIGTGFFKPCVSVMVGQLYQANDPRRDSGFTIFYMGINLGALLSPIVAGTLGEKIGWHWGFGAAAVGMLAGLACYQALRPKYLKGIGLAPHHAPTHAEGHAPTPAEIEQAKRDEHEATRPLTKVDFERLTVIVILAVLGNIMFWAFFEQAGTTLNVFAQANTDRHLFGSEFPATWYQAVNPLAIVVCAPLFSWLWVRLDKMGMNPSTPLKFAWGQWLLGLGFIAMVFGALEAEHGLAGPQWLFLVFIISTWGELCLSPVGLSMVTKLAPKRLQSLMMGVWFLSMAGANIVAAQVAVLSRSFLPGEGGEAPASTFVIPGLPGFFLLLVLLPAAGGVLVAILAPSLRRMMHGIK